MPMFSESDSGGRASGGGRGPVADRLATHQGDTRYNAGPDLSKLPGTVASDYVWDPDAQVWAFNGQARPGYIYAPSKDNTKDGRTGWVPVADGNDPTGLFHGWTKGQLLGLGGIGAAAAAPFLAGLFTGGGGAAAAGSAASSAVPDIGVTAGLGATVPGTVAAGFPAAAAGTAAGSGAAGAASAAVNGAGMTFGIKDALQFAPLLGSLLKGTSGVSSTPPQNDLMNQLIQMQLSQIQQSQPLRDAVLKMAMGLMPTAYRSTLSPTTAVPGVQYPSAQTAIPRK